MLGDAALALTCGGAGVADGLVLVEGLIHALLALGPLCAKLGERRDSAHHDLSGVGGAAHARRATTRRAERVHSRVRQQAAQQRRPVEVMMVMTVVMIVMTVVMIVRVVMMVVRVVTRWRAGGADAWRESIAR